MWIFQFVFFSRGWMLKKFAFILGKKMRIEKFAWTYGDKIWIEKKGFLSVGVNTNFVSAVFSHGTMWIFQFGFFPRGWRLKKIAFTLGAKMRIEKFAWTHGEKIWNGKNHIDVSMRICSVKIFLCDSKAKFSIWIFVAMIQCEFCLFKKQSHGPMWIFQFGVFHRGSMLKKSSDPLRENPHWKNSHGSMAKKSELKKFALMCPCMYFCSSGLVSMSELRICQFGFLSLGVNTNFVS